MVFSYDNLVKYGLWFSALVSLFDAPNMVALYVVIPLVFLYCFTKYKVYYGNRYIVILSCFVLFILFSCVTTHYWDLTLAQLKSLLGTLMMCYIVSSLSLDRTKIPFLYSLWIIYYIGMLIYIPQMEVFNNFDYSQDRLNDSQLNANTIAYHTFYLTFALFILGEIVPKKTSKKMWRKVFYTTIPLSFLAALATGSRQVLLIQIPLILLLICTRYLGRIKHAKIFIIVIITSAFVSFFVAERVKDIFEHSVLATRYEKNLEKDSRTRLLKDAIGVGCEYPVLGVGPGNYVKFSYNKHFSHCTYTELFASCGFGALFLYLYMLWDFLKRQICHYRETKDNLFLVFFIFGIIYAIDNFLYVFYYALWLLSFFFLIASHSEYHYREFQEKLEC